MMKCPQCGKETLQKSVNVMVVNVCETCPGIWFSPGDMEEILDHKLDIRHLVTLSSGDPEPTEDAPSLPCPVCRGEVRLIPMKTHVTSRIEVCVCTVCYGKWVSGENLRNLVAHCTPKGIKALLIKIFRTKSPVTAQSKSY